MRSAELPCLQHHTAKQYLFLLLLNPALYGLRRLCFVGFVT